MTQQPQLEQEQKAARTTTSEKLQLNSSNTDNTDEGEEYYSSVPSTDGEHSSNDDDDDDDDDHDLNFLKFKVQELRCKLAEQGKASKRRGEIHARLEREMQQRLIKRLAIQFRKQKRVMEAKIREEIEYEYQESFGSLLHMAKDTTYNNCCEDIESIRSQSSRHSNRSQSSSSSRLRNLLSSSSSRDSFHKPAPLEWVESGDHDNEASNSANEISVDSTNFEHGNRRRDVVGPPFPQPPPPPPTKLNKRRPSSHSSQEGSTLCGDDNLQGRPPLLYFPPLLPPVDHDHDVESEDDKFKDDECEDDECEDDESEDDESEDDEFSNSIQTISQLLSLDGSNRTLSPPQPPPPRRPTPTPTPRHPNLLQKNSSETIGTTSLTTASYSGTTTGTTRTSANDTAGVDAASFYRRATSPSTSSKHYGSSVPDPTSSSSFHSMHPPPPQVIMTRNNSSEGKASNRMDPPPSWSHDHMISGSMMDSSTLPFSRQGYGSLPPPPPPPRRRRLTGFQQQLERMDHHNGTNTTRKRYGSSSSPSPHPSSSATPREPRSFHSLPPLPSSSSATPREPTSFHSLPPPPSLYSHREPPGPYPPPPPPRRRRRRTSRTNVGSVTSNLRNSAPLATTLGGRVASPTHHRNPARGSSFTTPCFGSGSENTSTSLSNHEEESTAEATTILSLPFSSNPRIGWEDDDSDNATCHGLKHHTEEDETIMPNNNIKNRQTEIASQYLLEAAIKMEKEETFKREEAIMPNYDADDAAASKKKKKKRRKKKKRDDSVVGIDCDLDPESLLTGDIRGPDVGNNGEGSITNPDCFEQSLICLSEDNGGLLGADNNGSISSSFVDAKQPRIGWDDDDASYSYVNVENNEIMMLPMKAGSTDTESTNRKKKKKRKGNNRNRVDRSDHQSSIKYAEDICKRIEESCHVHSGAIRFAEPEGRGAGGGEPHHHHRGRGRKKTRPLVCERHNAFMFSLFAVGALFLLIGILLFLDNRRSENDIENTGYSTTGEGDSKSMDINNITIIYNSSSSSNNNNNNNFTISITPKQDYVGGVYSLDDIFERGDATLHDASSNSSIEASLEPMLSLYTFEDTIVHYSSNDNSINDTPTSLATASDNDMATSRKGKSYGILFDVETTNPGGVSSPSPSPVTIRGMDLYLVDNVAPPIHYEVWTKEGSWQDDIRLRTTTTTTGPSHFLSGYHQVSQGMIRSISYEGESDSNHDFVVVSLPEFQDVEIGGGHATRRAFYITLSDDLLLFESYDVDEGESDRGRREAGSAVQASNGKLQVYYGAAVRAYPMETVDMATDFWDNAGFLGRIWTM